MIPKIELEFLSFHKKIVRDQIYIIKAGWKIFYDVNSYPAITKYMGFYQVWTTTVWTNLIVIPWSHSNIYRLRIKLQWVLWVGFLNCSTFSLFYDTIYLMCLSCFLSIKNLLFKAFFSYAASAFFPGLLLLNWWPDR